LLRKGFGRLGGKCYLCKSIMEIAENIDIIGYEWLGEEDGSVMMAAEDSWRGLAVEHGYRVYILPNPKGISSYQFHDDLWKDVHTLKCS